MSTFIKKAELPALILKIGLGLVFVVSAILKLFDMDQFELYIYSYHFFSLNFSFLVARAAIIIELVLGIGLISNIFHKLMWWGSVAMLIGYTGLLIYALLMGRTDNCHCFGDMIRFNPIQSLLKNVVLMVLFILVYRVKEFQFKGRWLALTAMAVLCSVVVFALNPPDNYTPSYNKTNNLQTDLFKEALLEPPLNTLELTKGKKVVGILSSSCDLCKITAKKLSLMQSYYEFPDQDVVYIFMGSDESIERFYIESESTRYQYVIFDNLKRLLKINNGAFPLLVLMNEGEVVHEYGYRNMNEEEIKYFFQSR